MTRRARSGPRSFDPVLLGNRECDAWAAYYRREWRRFLVAAVGMVRTGFGMPWPKTLLGAWWVLRANQAWAPYPDNDPDAARRFMARFYRLTTDQLPLDPVRAAELEVEWWRLHRLHQREDAAGERDLTAALVALYGYVYSAEPGTVEPAARHRVAAMDLSDAWVDGSRALDDPLLAAERRELVASYTALRAAVEARS